MIGLTLAGLYALYLWRVKEIPELIFKKSTSLLFWLYTVTACVLFTYLLFGIFLVGAEVALSEMSWLSIALGIGFAGELGLLAFLLMAPPMLLPIAGAHLLRTSVRVAEQSFIWDKKRLVFGCVLIALAFVVDVGMMLFSRLLT